MNAQHRNRNLVSEAMAFSCGKERVEDFDVDALDAYHHGMRIIAILSFIEKNPDEESFASALVLIKLLNGPTTIEDIFKRFGARVTHTVALLLRRYDISWLSGEMTEESLPPLGEKTSKVVAYSADAIAVSMELNQMLAILANPIEDYHKKDRIEKIENTEAYLSKFVTNWSAFRDVVARHSKTIISALSFTGRDYNKYTVFVDDNFHFMDISERYCCGNFDTEEEALVCARSIVDDSLTNAENHTEAEDAIEQYKMFGEDPWIVSPSGADKSPSFSSWAYATVRAHELVRKPSNT